MRAPSLGSMARGAACEDLWPTSDTGRSASSPKFGPDLRADVGTENRRSEANGWKYKRRLTEPIGDRASPMTPSIRVNDSPATYAERNGSHYFRRYTAGVVITYRQSSEVRVRVHQRVRKPPGRVPSSVVYQQCGVRAVGHVHENVVTVAQETVLQMRNVRLVIDHQIGQQRVGPEDFRWKCNTSKLKTITGLRIGHPIDFKWRLTLCPS